MHENILYDELTVYENLQFVKAFYDGGNVFLDDVFSLLNIDNVMNKKVRELSFGWRRRVNIARALINKPKIFIIDEPLTGLDDAGKNAVIKIIHSIIRQGGTVVTAAPHIAKPLIKNVAHVIYKVDNNNIHKSGGAR